MRGIAAVILVAVALAPAALRAQQRLKLRPGTYVRLVATQTVDGREISTVGRVQSLTADTLVLITDMDRARIAVAVADVSGLWIRRGGAGRAAMKGAAIGAAIGVAGALVPEGEGEVQLGSEAAPALGLVGALIGAGVGAARARTSWERVPMPLRL